MSTINGFQLLSLPDHVKENMLPHNNQLPAQNETLLSSQNEKPAFKFLSLPSAPSAERSHKLIVIPKQTPVMPSIPLLQLPKNVQNMPTKRQLIFEAKNSPRRYNLPLLTKPPVIEEPKLIKMPIAKEIREKEPVLIQIPIQNYQNLESSPQFKPNLYQYEQNGLRMGKAVKDQFQNSEPESSGHQPKNSEGFRANGDDVAVKSVERLSQKSSGHTHKRKRLRKRQESKEIMENLQDKSNQFSYSQNTPAKVHKKSSRGTQTTEDTKRKMKDKKKRLNLLNLLEKAALLEGSEISSDEETILSVMKERSHLVQEEPYSKARIEIGVKKPTIEELLLQNFDQSQESASRESKALRKSQVRENARLSNIINERSGIRHKTESSTQTVDETHFPKIDLHKKPKAAAGPSWSEMISLASTKNISSVPNSAISLKEIGVQVSAFDPKIDKIEQMSQTDFTQEKDVASLLLQNLKDERMAEKMKDRDVLLKADVVNEESKYPWQYVADADFSDVLPSKQEMKSNDEFESHIRKKQKGASNDADKQYKSSIVSEDVKVEQKNKHTSSQSGRAHLPPEVLLGLKVQDDVITARNIDSDETNKPLNVIDISRPSSPLTATKDEGKYLVIEDIPVEKLIESCEADDEEAKKEWKLLSDSLQNDLQENQVYKIDEEAVKSRERMPVERRRVFADSQEDNQMKFKDRKSEIAANSERFKRVIETGPKDRLNNNLRNMSVQLDALDELYDQLEKDMKSSSMLMDFVETVHHGFFQEPDVFKKISSRTDRHPSKPPASHLEKQQPRQDQPPFIKEDESIEMYKPEDLQTVKMQSEKRADSVEKEESKEFTSIELDKANEILNEDSAEDIGDHSEESSRQSDIDDMISDDGRLSLTSGATEEKSQPVDGTTHEVDEEDRVRERIARKFPTMSRKRVEEDKIATEIELKQKLENKRKALQAWMKKKRSEQSQKYIKEVEEKRQKESRPFVGSKNTPKAAWKSRSGTGTPIKKKQVTEEIYQERIGGAQQLLDDLFAVRSDAVNIERSARPAPANEDKKKTRRPNFGQKSFAKLKRKMTDVYGKNNTRTRKTSIRSGTINKGKVGGNKLFDNISPSWKNSELGDFLKDIAGDNELLDEHDFTGNDLHLDLGSEYGNYEPYTSTARSGSNRYKLDLGQLSGRQTPDLDSSRAKSRRSVEGRDFVTRASMDNYKKKTAKLVRDSMKKYGSWDAGDSLEYTRHEDDSVLGSRELDRSDFLNDKERFMIDQILNERRSNDDVIAQESKRQRIRSPHRTMDGSEDVKEILMQYGLLDDDMNQYESEVTSNLLAEADALLEVDSEDEKVKIGESIDWNEIDNILNQN